MEPTVSLPLYSGLVLLVSAIRGGELVISKRNRRTLHATGVGAVGEPHFRAMVILHVAVLAGALLEAWVTRRSLRMGLAVPALGLLVGASALRWWVIATLGPHWNVAIMDSIGSARAVVTHGPYAHIRHPNYVAVFAELLALPLVHGAWLTAAAGAVAHVWVLRHRIRAEESVLLAHPSYRAVMAQRPRFLPRPLLTSLEHAWDVVRLGRPLFLLGGLALYGLGVAASPGLIRGQLFWLGLGAVCCLQLMTHYSNEYFDYAADSANRTPTAWSGGSRVLCEGRLPRWAALVAALVAAGLGLALAVVIRRVAGLLPAALLVGIAALSWTYSAPPGRLHSRGLGEVDGALVVTVLVPLFALALHAPGLTGLRPLLLATVPPGCLQFAMLMAVAIPDAAADAQVGKRTLAVRLGSTWAWRTHAAATALAYATVPVLYVAGLPRAVALAALVVAPFAARHLARMSRGRALQSPNWPALTFWPAALLILTTAAEAVAFLLL